MPCLPSDSSTSLTGISALCGLWDRFFHGWFCLKNEAEVVFRFGIDYLLNSSLLNCFLYWDMLIVFTILILYTFIAFRSGIVFQTVTFLLTKYDNSSHLLYLTIIIVPPLKSLFSFLLFPSFFYCCHQKEEAVELIIRNQSQCKIEFPFFAFFKIEVDHLSYE